MEFSLSSQDNNAEKCNKRPGLSRLILQESCILHTSWAVVLGSFDKIAGIA